MASWSGPSKYSSNSSIANRRVTRPSASLNHVLRKAGLEVSAEDEPEAPEENLQAEIPQAPCSEITLRGESRSASPSKKVEARSEPALDEETQNLSHQSLTDVDLFAS